MTTKLTDKNISNVSNLGLQWQSVITADGSTTTTAVAGQGYFIDTTSAAHTINLPASATAGDTVAIKDYAGTFGTNALTIGRNGHNIQGVANDSQISTVRANVELVYIDSTKGWLYTNESNVADLELPLFIEATGGTITTSGDYKIHTFTGDGCFVVTGAGQNNPTYPSTVDYLVVAGGAGSSRDGAGGGGAGGFRESKDSTLSSPHTASPLAATTGLTITATTYPITVGAGGAANASPCSRGGNGSSSIFSTITSAGGGGGGSPGANCGANGGSGGGGRSNTSASGGSGNTPPVSPPQGNNGGGTNGINPPTCNVGGGGGGATAVGQTGGGPQTGDGGAGATTSISGSPTAYAGGGGGGGNGSPGAPSGGIGGGGDGGAPGGQGLDGTANTGGGGGGSAGPGSPCVGGVGGKGIVIIRYKYQ